MQGIVLTVGTHDGYWKLLLTVVIGSCCSWWVLEAVAETAMQTATSHEAIINTELTPQVLV